MAVDPLTPIRLTTAYFILFCITLHVFTGINLMLFPDAKGSTTVSEVVAFFGAPLHASFAYLFAAICAMFSLRLAYPLNIFALLPQQAILIMAALGIIQSVWLGHFSDGVVRPRGFLAQDHCELVLIGMFHAGVLLMRAAMSSRLGPGLFYHPLEKVGM